MNNKQELNSAGASRNYSEIQKERRTIPLVDILSRGRIMVLVSMDQVDAALKTLEEASRFEAERHKNEQATHFENFIDTFSVANEIAESLK